MRAFSRIQCSWWPGPLVSAKLPCSRYVSARDARTRTFGSLTSSVVSRVSIVCRRTEEGSEVQAVKRVSHCCCRESMIHADSPRPLLGPEELSASKLSPSIPDAISCSALGPSPRLSRSIWLHSSQAARFSATCGASTYEKNSSISLRSESQSASAGKSYCLVCARVCQSSTPDERAGSQQVEASSPLDACQRRCYVAGPGPSSRADRHASVLRPWRCTVSPLLASISHSV